MFPYRDENETQRAAIVTGAIIALNVLVWIVVQGGGSTLALARSVCNLGLIPGELTASLPVGTRFPIGDGLVCATDPGRQISHLVTSMFLHGSWMHLLGNMWFLWLFGNNVEDSMGRLRFVVFYLLCGLAAAMGQVITNPDSAIPMVGASGAISGVLGGYMLLFPRNKVRVLTGRGVMAVPAVMMLGLWILIQFLNGFGAIAQTPETGGVAYVAHIGGFLAGMALVKLLARRTRPVAYA